MKKSESKSRRETTLEVMRDGLPRSPMEIRKLAKVTKLDSLLGQMWQKGDLMASKIVSAYTLEQRAGRFKWTPRRFRFYVVANKNCSETVLNVSYSRWNKWLRKNEIIKERLLFKPYTKKAVSRKEKVLSRILSQLKESDVALFSEEIAAKTKIAQAKVANELCYLKKKGIVTSKGWFNPDLGKETIFDKGYLWFVETEQYGNRLNKHDLLTGRAQQIYENIKANSEYEKRLTPKTELFGGSKGSRNENIMKYLRSVYTDIADQEISGDTFYFITGTLTEKELQEQIEYWKNFKSSRSSVFSRLGHAFECFFEHAIQAMWDAKDFKIYNMQWRFQISRNDGYKKLNCQLSRRTKPRRLSEFDRILTLNLAPFSENVPTQIALIFESRYKQAFFYDEWNKFLQKIADTREYGTTMTLRAENGFPVRVMAPKANVIPIMIIPHSGKNEKGKSFASYVHSQGGLVLFASEFEKYMRKKTGKSFTFKSLFKRWLKTESGRMKFAEYLLEFFNSDVNNNA